MKEINVGLIGHRWMGRAHTYAFTALPVFFDLGVKVVKKMICANEDDIEDAAKRWGWEEWSKNWNDVINNNSIDLIVIAAPNDIHSEIAIAAAKAGKHILCEKPLALNLKEAENVVKEVASANVVNMLGLNYRRVPAIALAKQLIEDGSIGYIYHFRGCYQQSWLVDPNFPLVWRLKKAQAGSGPLGDLGSHVIDLAIHLVGSIDEIVCVEETFLKERPKLISADGIVAKAGKEFGEVDVEDSALFLARFTNKKALGCFEMTRYGTGHRNKNFIEINGSKGAIMFDMEKMNELQFYNVSDRANVQGFRRIQLGESVHPYMSNWWPAGHLIGYGDTFVNQAYDLVCAIKEGKQVRPNFLDGLENQYVLDAADRSAKEKRWVKINFKKS